MMSFVAPSRMMICDATAACSQVEPINAFRLTLSQTHENPYL
jgi:hypothetical protein